MESDENAEGSLRGTVVPLNRPFLLGKGDQGAPRSKMWATDRRENLRLSLLWSEASRLA